MAQDSLEVFFENWNIQKLVITNVNVITMQNETLGESKDVFVSEGLIERIEDFNPDNHNGYEVIDGSGKYLIPGLADMHTHLIPDENLGYDLFLFLAQGVTTVRIMWGFLNHVAVRDSINNGSLLGPNVYVASAGFDGLNKTWPGSVNTSSIEEVRDYVDAYKDANFDFIKVYSGLPRNEYFELVEYAWENDIPPVGHVPSVVDYSEALSAGQYSIEHFTNFLGSSSGTNDLLNQLRDLDVYNCPTLSVLSRVSTNISQFRDITWYEYISPEGKDFFDQTKPTFAVNSAFDRNKELTLQVHQSGGKILSGTDTGIRYVLPGISLHEELEYYASIGLTNFEVLEASTTIVADFLNKENTGKILPNYKADMVLLGSNPLVDISNTQDIQGVVVGGIWISSTTIDDTLELIKKYYGE